MCTQPLLDVPTFPFSHLSSSKHLARPRYLISRPLLSVDDVTTETRTQLKDVDSLWISSGALIRALTVNEVNMKKKMNVVVIPSPMLKKRYTDVSSYTFESSHTFKFSSSFIWEHASDSKAWFALIKAFCLEFTTSDDVSLNLYMRGDVSEFASVDVMERVKPDKGLIMSAIE